MRHTSAFMVIDIDQFVSARIRQLRIDNGVTQQALADRAGLSIPTISRIENAHVGVGIGALADICAALGLSLGTFFEPTTEPRGLPPETARVVELMATMSRDGRAAVLKAVEAIDELIDARR